MPKFIIDGKFGYEPGENIRKLVYGESEGNAIERYLKWIEKHHPTLWDRIVTNIEVTELENDDAEQK